MKSDSRYNTENLVLNGAGHRSHLHGLMGRTLFQSIYMTDEPGQGRRAPESRLWLRGASVCSGCRVAVLRVGGA